MPPQKRSVGDEDKDEENGGKKRPQEGTEGDQKGRERGRRRRRKVGTKVGSARRDEAFLSHPSLFFSLLSLFRDHLSEIHLLKLLLHGHDAASMMGHWRVEAPDRGASSINYEAN